MRTAPGLRRPRGDRGAPGAAGTFALFRLALRRDRVRLLLWWSSFGVFVGYIGGSQQAVASTQAELRAVTSFFSVPIGRLFTGPSFGMDSPTYERLFAAGFAPYLYVLAAIMSLLLVVRHTRAEEEHGRTEMVRAGVVGRRAPLLAALLLALLANVGAGVVVAGAAVGIGFATQGSILVGAGTALSGAVFAGVAAVAAQLTLTAGTAGGLAGGVVAASFVLRGLGDMLSPTGSALSWASPLGWAAQVAPFVLDRWWPLALSAALATLLVGTALILLAGRDLGAGLLPVRPGRPEAGAALGSPVGLAARLQLRAALGWGGAVLVLGVVDGAFTQALVDASEGMPLALTLVLGPGRLTTEYLMFLGAFSAVAVVAYTVAAASKLLTEEGSGRADLVLATRVSRGAWLGSHALVIAVTATVTMLLVGAGTGLAAALVTGDWWGLRAAVAAHAGPLPGVLFLVGLWAALYGWRPRSLPVVGWALVTLVAVVTLFGELLTLPAFVRGLSPFEHLARLPEQEFAWLPAAVLLGAGGLLVAIGNWLFRRREIGGT